MTFGVTSSGFNLKRLDDIVTEINSALRSTIDPNLDLGSNTPEGQLVGVFADRLASLWEGLQDTYNSQYPQLSEDISLDNAVSLTNVTRLSATKSTVTATITGTPTTIVTTGFIASVSGSPDSTFITLQDYTIGGGGTVDVFMEAENTGPVQALSGSLTVIETPIAGVDSITNSIDADLGRDIESDADLKSRRLQLLQRSGTGTLEGIRNSLLNVDDVDQAVVLENVTLVTDSNGIPGKAFECIVQGGDNTDIAQTIFDTKPIGIESHGDITVVINDSQGIDHDIKFSRPDEIDIYVIVNITPNTDDSEGPVYPVDGDSQIESSILEFTDDFLIGQDVLRDGDRGLSVPVNTVQGIRAAEILFGKTASPSTGTPVSIAPTELALFDSSRITVNS